MPERFEIYIVYKRRYINTLPFLSFPFFLMHIDEHVYCYNASKSSVVFPFTVKSNCTLPAYNVSGESPLRWWFVCHVETVKQISRQHECLTVQTMEP